MIHLVRLRMVLVVALASTFAATGTARAATTSWDAAADFSASSNPNGTWSYGWSQSRGSGFSLEPNAVEFYPGLFAWTGATTSLEPDVFFNSTDGLLNPAGTNPIPPHSLAFHPGPLGQNAIVRWTAPVAGTYQVDAAFVGRDDVGPTTTDVATLLDGIQLWQSEVSGYLQQQSFDETLSLNAGDTLDFTVGDGTDGNYYYDSTGLSATITSIVTDTTPPTTSASFSTLAGPYVPGTWTNQDVTVALAASDDSGGSGVASTYVGVDDAGCTPLALGACDTYTSPFAVGSDGVHSLTYFSSDAAGNIEQPRSASIEIDKTPPAINCSPLSADTFLIGQPNAVVTATVADGGSGPQQQTVSAPVSTATAGPGSVTLTGADLAGNTASVTCSYAVQYGFGGFLSPVKAPSTINTGKAGKVYPIKFQLTDAAGNFISSLAAVVGVTAKPTSCNAFSTDPTDALTTTTAGSSGLHYDSTANQYVYNWATSGTGCYTLFLNLADGRSLPLYFNLS